LFTREIPIGERCTGKQSSFILGTAQNKLTLAQNNIFNFNLVIFINEIYRINLGPEAALILK
jgi:hypothetical protein